jgi:hypothetical protein
LSVKSGHTGPDHLRDLRGVLDREKAEIGVLITLENPSRSMKTEAASAGFYKSPWGNHSRLQILTIEDLLDGKKIDYPPEQGNVTFKKAPRVEKAPKHEYAGSLVQEQAIQQDDLTPTEIEALQEIANTGLLKKATLSKELKRLTKLGYIQKNFGGLLATTKGKLYLAPAVHVAEVEMI